jgi:peptidoglycan biosynthesis protein MviN/MurJ (putative lipid II flippase)
VGCVHRRRAQLALQIRPLLKIGMLGRPRLDWRDPGVRRVLIAMGPAVIGVSAAQISALINTQLAASLGDGRISWITYADRLMEFPSALLGVALGTVLLPSLAKLHAEARHDEYTSLLDWGLRLAFLLALPAAVALWILRSRSSPRFTSTGASRSRTCCRRAPRSSATAWACSGSSWSRSWRRASMRGR